MKYDKIYNSIIERAKCRITEATTESHHIIPKCIGGDNSKENLVDLTHREHFIAHLLLAKIYGGKLIYAAHMMSNMKKYSSRKYEHLRLLYIEECKKKILSESTKRKISSNKVRAKKISEALSGRKKNPEHIKNIVKSRINNNSYVRTPEMNEKTSISLSGKLNPMYGKTHNAESRLKISNANKQTVMCPHCNKVGGIAIMKRWHFNKCKEFTNE